MIPYPSAEFSRLRNASREPPSVIKKRVADILEQVQKKGDAALFDLTRRLDGFGLNARNLRVSRNELQGARVPQNLKKAGNSTLREVRCFAKQSFPKNWRDANGHGAQVGEKYDPLHRVGIYVPGGSVPLVSTVFMTVPLAKVAGVEEIVVCSPPPIAEPLLWALKVCGASEVYRLGGAQAMAAMAYGTKTIRPVDKLFGPGNQYVTEAKRQLFGVAGMDLLAGPSELMVLADESTRMEWAAADLLAQAEHGSGVERIFCVSPSRKVLQEIENELKRQGAGETAHSGLKNVLKKGCWFIQTKNRAQMTEVANLMAPEHLQVMTRQARRLASQIKTAGAIFIGNRSPTVLGDFVAGPSHTLPTGGAGRAFSGLRPVDFMRRTSLVEYSHSSLVKAAAGVEAFAKIEGLPFHLRSMTRRL